MINNNYKLISDYSLLNLTWIPSQPYIIDYDKSEKFIFPYEKNDNINEIILNKVSEMNEEFNDEILNNCNDDILNNCNDYTIIVIIIDCHELFFYIKKNEYLINIKKWILKYVNTCDIKYNIMFINNGLNIINCINITINDITDRLICIFYVKNKNISIYLKCSCNNHLENNIKIYELDYICSKCDCDHGILIPEYIDIYDIPKNIPPIYQDIITDIDWDNLKKKIKLIFNNHNKYNQLELKKNIEESIKIIKQTISRIDYDDYYNLLSYEEQEYLYYKNLKL